MLGPPGLPGLDGLDGLAGQKGIKGSSGNSIVLYNMTTILIYLFLNAVQIIMYVFIVVYSFVSNL